MRRKMNFIKLLFLETIFLSLLCLTCGNAAEYFVATSGNDANAGSFSQPWLTLRKAVLTLQAGDTLYIRGGTYTGTENINLYRLGEGNSGNATDPIIIKNYPDETPVLDGGFTTTNGRNPIFNIDGNSYITLDGLTIKGGSLANILLGHKSFARNITIKNCDIKEFVANDNSANIFIKRDTDNIVIMNNTLRDMAVGSTKTGNGAGIIIFHCGTLDIRNNDIFNTNVGIYYKHSTDDGKTTTIENNLIYDQTRWGMQISSSDTIIRNNIIRDTPSVGIKIFGESSTCDNVHGARNQIIHNTLIGLSAGISLNRSESCIGAVDTIVRDNLVYDYSSGSYRGVAIWAGRSSDSSNTTLSNNLIYSQYNQFPVRVNSNSYTFSNIPSSVISVANISSEALFQDYAGKNFKLMPGSPGKNMASDGTDMGVNIYIVGRFPIDTIAPSAPQNLRIE